MTDEFPIHINYAVMKAGRGLDALVAEHVMGFEVRTTEQMLGDDFRPEDDWAVYYKKTEGTCGRVTAWNPVLWYSTKIEYAWMAFEKAAELNKHAKWIRAMHWEGIDPELPYGCQYGEGLEVSWAETMPLAICRAALMAWEKK